MKTTLIIITLTLSSCYTSRTVRYPDGRWERTVALGLRTEISHNTIMGTTAKGNTTPGGLIGAAIGIIGKVIAQ